MEMEDEYLLNIEDDIHLFCLHYIYLTRINRALEQFTEAWNNHPLSSCHNMSPIQLWIYGLSNGNENMTKDAREVKMLSKHFLIMHEVIDIIFLQTG